MTTLSDYKTIIKILQLCINIEWNADNRSPKGFLEITSDIIEDLQILLDKAFITECWIDDTQLSSDPANLVNYLGSKVFFDFFLPAPNEEFALVKNLDALLAYPKFQLTLPSNLYLIECASNTIPKKYTDTVSFAYLLKITSDHVTEDVDIRTCYFYDGVKIIVPIKYSECQLRELNGLEDLIHSFQTPRLKERIKIFKSALIKSAISAPSESQLFPYLVENFFQIINSRFQVQSATPSPWVLASSKKTS